MREDEGRKEMKRQKENRRMKSVGLQESQKREEPQPSEERIDLHKKFFSFFLFLSSTT